MKHESFVLILGDSFRHSLFLRLIMLGGLEPQIVFVVRSKTLSARVRRAPSSTLFSLFQGLAESLRNPILRVKLSFTPRVYNCIFITDVNDHSVYTLLRTLQPSLVFVYGSNVIKSKLLSINTAWLNAHGGVLPGYRGLDSNLWAVSEDRFDLVGYSIHKIVPQIDAGEILITNRVEITSLIDLLTVRLKIANKLSQDLVTFVCGEVSFRNLDFMPNTNEDSEYRSHIMFLPLLRCVIKAFRKGL